MAAGGEVRLQPRKLSGRRPAVADGLHQHPAVDLLAALLVAQRPQPLPGDRGGGADLGRQLPGVEPPATCQLPPQVGVGDAVAHQPGAQLGKARVAVPCGAQHAQQVTGEPGRHADLAGERRRVDRLAAVDLARQPGVGDPLPRWPRVGRPLLLGLLGGSGGVGGASHRRPPSRCGHTTRAAAWPCLRSRRRCMRSKARSVLRPSRRCARASRRAARSSARWRRACSRGW